MDRLPSVNTHDTVPLHRWKIVPISRGQREDVRADDLIMGGLYRQCSTYRGGGGYDLFPHKAAGRFGGHPDDYNQQFIVQLQGCNLDCPYCYVTRAGVWGKPYFKTTYDMASDFRRTGLPVFHLMGGAPALQMKHWPELIANLRSYTPNVVFHSDLMLSEGHYDEGLLRAVGRERCLYAINIKGLTAEEWKRNTRKDLDEFWFWENWRRVQQSGLPSYLTFTGCAEGNMNEFMLRAEDEGIAILRWLQGSNHIDLIDYNALKHVDDVPWGAQDRS